MNNSQNTRMIRLLNVSDHKPERETTSKLHPLQTRLVYTNIFFIEF